MTGRTAVIIKSSGVWDGEGQTTLMQTIQERIAQTSQQEGRHRFPWPLRWLNWFIPN